MIAFLRSRVCYNGYSYVTASKQGQQKLLWPGFKPGFLQPQCKVLTRKKLLLSDRYTPCTHIVDHTISKLACLIKVLDYKYMMWYDIWCFDCLLVYFLYQK